MRPKFTIPGLGFMALAILICWAAGCSNDSSVTTSIIPGSADDGDFLVAQGQIDAYLDSADVIYSMTLGKMYPVQTEPRNPGQERYNPETPANIGINKVGHDFSTESWVTGYSDGWHWLEVTDTGEDYIFHFADSVRFMGDELILSEAEGLDYLRFIRHWDYVNEITTSTYTDLSGHLDIEATGLDGDVATVNGFDNFLVEWHYITVDSTVDAIFGVETTIENVQINRADDDLWSCGCPVSGTLNLDMNISYTVTANAFPVMTARSWDITVELDNGTATVTAVSNQQYWTYTREICTVE